MASYMGLPRCGHFRLESQSLVSAVDDDGVAGPNSPPMMRLERGFST